MLTTATPATDRDPERPALVILTGDTYTVLGLDAERNRRSNAGKTGAAVRWENERNAAGNANASGNAMPRRDETSKDEITPPPQVGRRKEGTNPRAVGTNPRANGTAPRQLREGEKRAGFPESFEQILLRKSAEARG